MAYSVAQRVISKKTAFTIIVMISAENQSCCITLHSFASGIFLPDMKKNIGQTMKKMSFVRFMHYKMFILRSMSEK